MARIAEAARRDKARKSVLRPSDLKTENGRKEILLKAAYDLLKACHDSHFVLDVMSTSVFYDDADCDGNCLMEDIACELGIDADDKDKP